MEAQTKRGCSFPGSGSFVYQDAYDIIYRTSWETTRSGLDITTIIQDPRVPGQIQQARRDGRTLFQRGLVTIDRQILVDTDDGYMILSSGGSQEVEFFQTSFPCGPKPIDPFCYHLDNLFSETIAGVVTCGPRWTDPDVVADDVVTWGDVDQTDGLVVAESAQLFQWVSIWDQSDALESTCV